MKQNLFSSLIHSTTIQLILLIGWTSLHLITGNTLYAFFIIVFFLIVSRIRHSNIIIMATVFLFIYFYLPSTNTLYEIRNITLHASQQRSHIVPTILSPDAGREVLPVEVQEMLCLMESHNIPDYRLARPLDTNLEIHQRILESAWPRKMDVSSSYLIHSLDISDFQLPLPLDYTTSSYLFILTTELHEFQSSPYYTMIDKRKKVALVYRH